jgi:N-acetylmuramoyl-L-alanine amidase
MLLPYPVLRFLILIMRLNLTKSLCLLLLLSVLLGGVGCENFGGAGAGQFHTVVVDPGHGGHDYGGRARFGINEKDLALDTALRLRSELEHRGFKVVMTRTTDVFIPLDGRVAVSNATPDSIFVSIHYNWDRYRAGHGVETYYCSPSSGRLAANVLHELAGAYRTVDRGVKNGCWIRVLRKNRRPAILVECGFDSNPAENAILQTSAGRQSIAEAIASGIQAERNGRNP